MSLQTIVQNMVTAKEPEATIAKVIKHYNQINISPLKQVEEVETISPLSVALLLSLPVKFVSDNPIPESVRC